ncbi:MAG: BatD family protein [Bacteroides sp.]|nr:BatD family protein [Bacteroides sp.]
MKRYLFLITLLTVLAGRSVAQSVTVDATIDSLQILIGEQAKIKLQVSLDANKSAIFPVYTDTLVRGVEIIDIAKPDTQMLNDGRRSLITQEYTITSFDSALYYLPPMEVLVDNQAYRSKALALKVYSMPVDTLHPDQFFGPKTVMKVPFAWEDWYVSITCTILFIPILLLLIYLVKRICDNKPIIRKIKVEPKLPPHQLAMQEIERIKSEKVWQKGQPKEYYTELTDIIRTYIKDRFGFNALEMTSSEIIDKLMEMKDKEAIDDLRSLFQTADLVKFAKHNPLMNENDANLINAVDFINDTKEKIDENAKPQPTEITIVEKRSLRTKILLGAGIAILAAALIGSMIYVGLKLYNYIA